MEQSILESLKYPVGKYVKPKKISADDIKKHINTLHEFPGKVKLEVSGLDKNALAFTHRPEGWTIAQLVHHCADSHMNAYIRTKLAITETNPTITPYIESEWAKTIDSTDAPIEWSLQIIEGMHMRWTKLLSSLSQQQLEMTFFHPQHNRNIPVAELIPMYAWHCNHHLAHIKQAKQYKNNF
jgi:hypothetical protein